MSTKEVSSKDVQDFKEVRLAMGEQVSSTNLDDHEETKKDQAPVRPSSVESDEDNQQYAAYAENEDQQESLVKESLRKAGFDPDSAESARPTGAQVQKALKYFDLGIKLEVTLYEMQSILFNSSILELGFFILGFLFFARHIKNMKTFWLFLPHFVRGICGILIYIRLPKSYQLVEGLDFDDAESGRPIGFDEIHERLKFNVEKVFFFEIKKILRIIKVFGVLTVISNFLDFFNFIVILNYFGQPGMEYEECTLMFLVLVFNGINIYYALNFMLLKFRFPDYISKYIIEAFFSVGILVQQKLEIWAQVKADKVSSKFNRSSSGQGNSGPVSTS